MDRNNASRQLLTVLGRLAACAVSLTFVCTPPALADQVDPIAQPGDIASTQSDLANTYVTQMHADPLVASCAAHGNFIASTSNALDHVEFPPSSFDSAHATVTPWNDSFDEGKQRVKVDTIVTVDGIGIPKDSGHAPYDLKFRCGYIGQQILAFCRCSGGAVFRQHGRQARLEVEEGQRQEEGDVGKIEPQVFGDEHEAQQQVGSQIDDEIGHEVDGKKDQHEKEVDEAMTA